MKLILFSSQRIDNTKNHNKMSDLNISGNESLQDIAIPIEDDNIHSRFANVLKKFRIDFGTNDLRSIALGFKLITYKKLSNLYDSDPTKSEDISNWILECKFWTILESLLDVKFNRNLSSSSQSIIPNNSLDSSDFCEYSSDTVINDKVISSDIELLQIFTCLSSLSETFKLDFPNQSDNDNDDNDSIQTVTKWLHTLNQLNSFNKDPNLVKNLDIDAPSRTNLKINEKDKKSDEFFFKKAYKLLISRDFDELNSLCELTNNWDFALMIAGLNDRIDPIIDLNDFSGNTIPSGVKSKLLRSRTIYSLTNNTEISKYEKACYGILSSDFISSSNAAESWEEKLYLYLKNLLNHRLENKILKIYKDLNMESELSLLYKLNKPPVVSNNVDDILNKLTSDENLTVKEQSRHSIRVLVGSLISNNVKDLMNNTVKSLDSLLLNNDDAEIKNEISNESYLLRILTHLSIILQLIYGEDIISNEDYTKLLKFYILRLILYKSYELVPIYISFIPTVDQMIEIYSSLLYQFEYSIQDRASQIDGMRKLQLPLESILRKTIERGFKETNDYYPTNIEIQLNYEVDDIDKKLYSTIFWFIDSSMIIDAIDATVILLRRFLLVGKIGAAIEFLETFSLPDLLDDYKSKYSIYSTLPNSENLDIQLIPSYKMHELTQYWNLFKTFKLLISYDQENSIFEELDLVIKSLYKLVKTWLFDLITNDQDIEITSSDIEIYNELRRIYIPTIFNTLFDILIENNHPNKKFIQDAMDLVNLLADEEFKLYEIFNSTNELKPFLSKLANVGCQLYGEFKEGVYV